MASIVTFFVCNSILFSNNYSPLKTKFLLFLLIVQFNCIHLFSQTINSGLQPSFLVDPFFGVERGNVLCGVSLPFSMLRLSPNVLDMNNTTGYTTGNRIGGFSHTHTSGTGGSARYGNLMTIPIAGRPTMDFYAVQSSNEFAKAGYYAVTLHRKPGDCTAELTSTEHVGMHRYKFFNWSGVVNFESSILLDVAHVLKRPKDKNAYCREAFVKIVSDTEIEGYGEYQGGWGGNNPYKIYFTAKFSKPVKDAGIWKDSSFLNNLKTDTLANSRVARRFGVWTVFDVQQNEEILVKLSISLLNNEKARENQKEINDWDFYHVRMNADSVWNQYLSKISIEGGTPEQQIMFYSGLRNTLLMPTDISGENPKWKTTAPSFWEHYAIWDVFRSVMPLHTLLFPDKQRKILLSLLDIYDNKGWLPDAWISGEYAMIQGGTNADVVFADAVVKNLGGFDINKAYKALLKNAETVSDNPEVKGRDLLLYNQLGYCPAGKVYRSVSRTLEYAYNDYCIAQVAKKLDKNQDVEKYLKRSMGSFMLFHQDYKFFLAKDEKGKWDLASLPIYKQEKEYSDAPWYYEGDAWVYSTYTPHAIRKLINLHGGNQAFVNHLDSMFHGGKFNLGNEPLMLVPYLYSFAGRYDKTAETVRSILNIQYRPGRKGIPGQDDSGAMSSWYVWSTLGIFPIAGQDIYLIGSPVFKKSVMKLENGKTFTIVANNVSEKNKYIVSVKLNGKEYNDSYIKHNDIMSGSVLEFQMSDKPSNWSNNSKIPSIE